MELIEKNGLKKLIASENKLLVPKTIELDEEGNEIPRQGAKVVYLAISASENDYEEIDKLEVT